MKTTTATALITLTLTTTLLLPALGEAKEPGLRTKLFLALMKSPRLASPYRKAVQQAAQKFVKQWNGSARVAGHEAARFGLTTGEARAGHIGVNSRDPVQLDVRWHDHMRLLYDSRAGGVRVLQELVANSKGPNGEMEIAVGPVVRGGAIVVQMRPAGAGVLAEVKGLKGGFGEWLRLLAAPKKAAESITLVPLAAPWRP